jgi:class 3 adenylate cyclase/tetratricopeptide (TPR) repeat protein
MTGDRIAERVSELHDDVRRSQAAGDHEGARRTLAAIQKLDPGNGLAEALLDGSARHCQMTLMFCDLVGSTALAERLDPEDMSDVLRLYRTTCAEVAERYGGFLEDRQGDGVLMRFGPPTVHEDDPYRAVRTGLEILELMGTRAPAVERELGISLAVRIAVHTGMVLIDAGDIVGTTPNEAARLQSLAHPNEVLISDNTWKLVDERFDVEPRGPSTLRGISRPIDTFAVLRERESSPLESARWLTSFAGRQPERDAIAALWRQARERISPPGLLVSGDPGIGKSRLLVESARSLGAKCELCQCSRYHTTTSLHAFRPFLARLCHIEDGDEPEVRLGKLRAAVGQDSDDLPLLATVLSIPPEITSPPAEKDESMLRLMALHAAAGIVQSRIERPVMLLVDDLQWADDSTLDLISLLLTAERPGIVMAFSARHGFMAPWPQDLVRSVELGPLSEDELEAIALEIPQSAALGEDQRRELISRSDGVPLFLEELARSTDALAWESRRPSTVRSGARHVPAALRDPLQARLAAPGVDLELAQIAATIGRDVHRQLLQRVADLSDDAFHEKLANLLAVGVVDRSDDRTVRFRHELIREVAYKTQPRKLLRRRHSRIADLLRIIDVGVADAGVAAFHLDRARRNDEAIDAYVEAAKSDQGLGAHKEATQRLTDALDVVERLADGAPRLRRELAVRQLRAFSAVMAGGYSTRECREDHARSVELCEALGLDLERLPSLMANWSYYCSCHLAEADRICAMVERVVRASRLDIPVREMGLGVTGFFAGRFDESRELLLAFVEHPWAQTPGGPPPGWRLPNDPYVGGCAHLAATLAMTGEPEHAQAIAERGLRRAIELPYPYGPFSVAYVRSQQALVHRLAGDHDAASEAGRGTAELGEKHGFALFMVAGRIQQNLSRAYGGDLDAVEPLAADVALWRALLASEVWSPYLLAEQAGAQAAAGRRQEAYESLEQALDCVSATGSDFYTAEILRIRGELRREDGDPRAQADLREAVEKARRQGASALVLRAETSLQAAHALPAP